MKKICLSLWCILCAVMLAGCSLLPAPREEVSLTLPEPEVEYQAPVDDSGLKNVQTMAIYLPGEDGRTLTRSFIDVNTTLERTQAYDLAHALLLQLSTYYGRTLSLYGPHSVMVSGGICSVNLTSSALILERQQLYTLCLCLSSSLCALPGINGVNVLIADQAPAMDITGNLPLGLLTAHGGEDSTSLWETFSSRRTPLGTDASTVSLTSNVTLYFPLSNGSGVVCESRSITFDGQTPAQLCLGLLEALSAGSWYSSGTADMPDLTALMTALPQVSTLTEGGKQIELSFVEDLDELLEQQGIDKGCFLASLVLTMTTLIPGITSVSIKIGSSSLLTLSNASHGTILFANGNIRRSSMEDYPMNQASIYLVQSGRFVSVMRSIPGDAGSSPRLLLNRLLAGPTAQERSAGIEPSLPYILSEQDILGIAVEGDTMILNLSEFFASSIANGIAENEQILCYSMVNTLCEALGLRRVVFFFNGKQVGELRGQLYWGGEFLYAPGLSAPDKG